MTNPAPAGGAGDRPSKRYLAPRQEQQGQPAQGGDQQQQQGGQQQGGQAPAGNDQQQQGSQNQGGQQQGGDQQQQSGQQQQGGQQQGGQQQGGNQQQGGQQQGGQQQDGNQQQGQQQQGGQQPSGQQQQGAQPSPQQQQGVQPSPQQQQGQPQPSGNGQQPNGGQQQGAQASPQGGASPSAGGASGQPASPTPSGDGASASASASAAPSVDDGGEWANVSQEPVTTTFKGSSSPSEYIGGIAKQKSGSTLSAGAKGGIAGGIVGGLAAIILAFVLWRMCRGRGKKLPPPAPRDMSQEYRPPSYAHHSNSRGPSMTMARSYSTLLGPPLRPTSHFDSYSSTSSQKYGSASTPSGSPSLSSSGTGSNTPGGMPVTVAGSPLNLYRDGSTASTGSGSGDGSNGLIPRHASGDQLRAPTPSDPQGSEFDSRTNSSDSRANSPRPSSLSLGSSGMRRSVPGMPRYPQASIRGAPHTGRQVTITVPRPLSTASSAVPDSPNQATYPSSRGGSMYSAPPSQRGSYIGGYSGHPAQRQSSYGEFGATTPIVHTSQHRRGRSNASSLGTPAEGEYNGREDIV